MSVCSWAVNGTQCLLAVSSTTGCGFLQALLRCTSTPHCRVSRVFCRKVAKDRLWGASLQYLALLESSLGSTVQFELHCIAVVIGRGSLSLLSKLGGPCIVAMLKLSYDCRPVGQSVFVSCSHLQRMPIFFLCRQLLVSLCGAPSLTRGCTIAFGPCQSSHSGVRVPHNSRPHFRSPYLHPPETGRPNYTCRALGSLFVACYNQQYRTTGKIIVFCI
jgi:hypothetical protein